MRLFDVIRIRVALVNANNCCTVFCVSFSHNCYVLRYFEAPVVGKVTFNHVRNTATSGAHS